MSQNNQKGQFKSNFGFLMACLGSAVGLGNLWSFPYKLGIGGGFAFLLIYAIMALVVGYPLVLGEIALGRKTKKAAVGAYQDADRRFTFNGVLQTVVPWLLICFYCTFGGYIMRYLFASVADLFSGSSALATTDPGAFFGNVIGHTGTATGFMGLFLLLTMIIVIGGVSGGIERFCKYAMPALFIMLVIIVVRSVTLPGAGAGLSFLFAPNLEPFSSFKGFFDVLSLAGGQLFFSLSLASSSMIAYGSYLAKQHDLEKDAAVIVIGDSTAALFAAMAIMPAVFAFGIEPGAGPGLLFVSMTTVFQSMGMAGKIFQLIFWLLVFFAVISSSIAMMEAGISAILDSRMRRGKSANRFVWALIMTCVAFAGNFMTAADQLGSGTLMQWFHILGQPDVLDVWDCIAEGILMPGTGLIMAFLLGWVIPGYIDDEVLTGGKFKSRRFFHVCIRWIGPAFMIMIVYGQICSFWG